VEARAARREAGGVEGAPRDASLTRLRFLLIAWVVLYHLDLTLRVSEALPWLRPVLGRGYLGVDGFFLLSGFALWLGYAGRPPQGRAGIGAFLLRRFAKVWPLHAVALLALAALVAAAAVAGVAIRDPDRFRAEDFLLQLALVNAWETTDRHAWNYPSWALSAEWAGYLAFPWVLRGVLGLPHRAVPAAALLAGAGLLVLSRHVPLVGLNLTIHLGLARFGLEFVLGLLLGRLATEGRLPRARPLLLAGALALAPAGLLLRQDALVVAGLAAAIAGLWLAGREGAAGPRAAPSPRPDPILRLGEASFGVYLCWIFVELALVAVLRAASPGPAGRVALMAAAFLACLAAGWLAWRFVEVPAQRWVLLLGRRRPAGALVADRP
jgi:peptidoglycan/LPS O-acetylase OafA/YrhL